jgi:sec-independent protein translocase protein TatA
MNQVQLATFGIWELLLILLIVVVIFGAGKLPQLGDALGKSIRNFKRSFKEEEERKEVAVEARRLEEPSERKSLPSAKSPILEKNSKANSKVDPM